MTTPATPQRELPPAFARGYMEPTPAEQLAADPESERTISAALVRDLVAFGLVGTGAVVGDTAAWIAGGVVPGLATLAGLLIALGLVLGASRSSR
jgi:hypothetical protein